MEYVKKDYSNRRIHLGIIAHCNMSDKYGLLYGFREPPYDGVRKIHENKLLFFEKDPCLEITENTLVSYLSYDYNGFTPKVDYVYPVSTLIKNREDNICHEDRLVNEGIPYFKYSSGREYCIYYPIINGNTCTVWRGLFGCGIYMNKEANIYEMYKELCSINYSGWPTLEEVTNAIIKFKKQIDSINAFEIIDTFEIMKIGRYISRPGRDDHYSEDLFQSLPNDDKFLSYLLPTKQENIFFDNNAYRSDGYREGVLLLDEEAKQSRDNAKAKYSKEKHLAFLISDYFSENLKKKERAEFLNSKIRKEFDIDNACEIASQFNGKITDEFISMLNEYNKSTVMGPLELNKS